MPRFKIHHVTRYTYQEPVRDSANQIILFPLRDQYQELIRQDLQISGEPALEVYKDYFGNEVGFFTYSEPHTELLVDSRVEVLVKPRPQPTDETPRQEQWQHLTNIRYQVPFIDFLKQETFSGMAEASQTAAMVSARTHTPLELARELNEYVFQNFSYNKEVTDVETTLDEIWALKAGVCQDFAHILLVLLRANGIPARYVSGYICPNKNGMRGEGATHAWVEAYIPDYGWLGLDPTNNCLVNDLHVRLATGRNFSNVSPVKGAYKGIAHHSLQVGVSVSYEDGHTVESETVLTAQPLKAALDGSPLNSYRRHLEMIQQQQQQ